MLARVVQGGAFYAQLRARLPVLGLTPLSSPYLSSVIKETLYHITRLFPKRAIASIPASQIEFYVPSSAASWVPVNEEYWEELVTRGRPDRMRVRLPSTAEDRKNSSFASPRHSLVGLERQMLMILTVPSVKIVLAGVLGFVSFIGLLLYVLIKHGPQGHSQRPL